MTTEIHGKTVRAMEVETPREVIVKPKSGKYFRAELTKHKLDPQREGYQFNALGRDPRTGRTISLAPRTWVELARPIE
ncbi:MAG: hypothetical protein UT39_C0011G0022 [Candidatus Woesebacteria bacterium GW2011_GWA1_39_21]|uniref:Uncharacterized protein n=1 Tax=Candidatus Woesebacteria bacterium GW2011_GWA1_39_21 TaxID=1618550 RepID=A0A0G0QLA1_9BACT|nr:MAG: hypothetical protein UT39_C0011G0022 [Candidatus Woesebacteria bacterium GW2011_GWA1_39_21]